jgi:hypothetical protein
MVIIHTKYTCLLSKKHLAGILKKRCGVPLFNISAGYNKIKDLGIIGAIYATNIN